MIEDQLTRDERIRLESVAQAVGSSMGSMSTVEHILDKASKIESYIREGKGVE